MNDSSHEGVLASEKQAMLREKPPKDPWNLVYLIMLLHGIGVLMPWNMFITIAPSYFVDYKLSVHNETTGSSEPTVYALNFFSYLGICSQLPNLLLNLINVFIEVKGGLARRIGISLIIVAVICVITIIFVFIDTSQMIAGFFFFTMFTVVILNAANGIYQNSVYGLVASFPHQFTNAIVLGNNLCGTFVSVINILTIIVFSNQQKLAAFTYFFIALLTVIACFVSFFILPKFEFYNYYMKKGAAEQEIDLADAPVQQGKVQLYLDVFKQAWGQCLNVFLVFFVTLTIFPAIMADVRPYHGSHSNEPYDFFISEELFTPITTFLLFNSLAMIGSAVANFVQWPSPPALIIPVALRILLIPIMMFCNYRPRYRTWPVFITSEYVFISFGLIMSFTSGYFSSVAMMYAPKVVDKAKAPIAGMMSAFFLICGICAGIAFTLPVSLFIDHLGPRSPLVKA